MNSKGCAVAPAPEHVASMWEAVKSIPAYCSHLSPPSCGLGSCQSTVLCGSD